MIRLCALIIALLLFPASAYAEEIPAAGGKLGSAQCNFTAIKDSLYGTESASSGGYTAVYKDKNGNPSALGKYQFIPTTRSGYIKAHPECKGEACDTNEAWISAPCHPVQECIMDAFTNENLTRIRSDPACQKLLENGGQTITGSGQGKTLTCKATESGLLGAMHLGGPSQCRKILANGTGDSDALGTSTAYYTCKHGGLSVPGNCTPAPADTIANNPSGAVATLPQQQFMNDGMDLSGPPNPLRTWWVGGLMLMAEQFTANMSAQVQAIGMMLDAKHQLETQRLFQQKTAEAHKDYQPSEQMCTFGTMARDLASTERSANLTRDAVSTHILHRELGTGEAVGQTETSDALSRLKLYRDKFCDPEDNAKGLKHLCPKPPAPELRNRDINYTQTIDQPLSLAIDMKDTKVTPDEEAVFALVDNLFAHHAMPRLPTSADELRKHQYGYMNLRSIAAMRGIARNSVANLVALKTATPNVTDQTSNAPFMRALLREFGLNDEEINKTLGDNPSYYAQMEVLTKKIYQNPIFYTNLYDKPANVQRIRAAMKAIKLMQDRDIQSALQRREMLMSMLLEIRLRERAEPAYNAAIGAMFGDETGSNADPM